jgi:hypothetical protein
MIMVQYSVSEAESASVVWCRWRGRIILGWVQLTTGGDLASETLRILTVPNMIANIQHSIYKLHFIMVNKVFSDLINIFTLSSVMQGAVVRITSACSNQ